MLAEARQVQAGQGDIGTLARYVDQLLAGIVAAQVQFVQDASGNPEVPQETVPVVMAAFEQLHQGLQHMHTALQTDDVDSALAGAGQVEEASMAIRSARDTYQSSLAEAGQTPFPFVNRLLLQLHYLANGGYETRFAISALNELPEFMGKIRRDLEIQEERVSHDEARASAEAAAAEIQTVCDGFYNALQQWNGATDRQKNQVLQQVYDRLQVATEQLSTALSAFVETDLSLGPTPILVINLVIRSFENWQAELIGQDDFLKVLKQAQLAMHDMIAQMSVAHAKAAADHLELVLGRMEEAMSMHGLDGVVGLLPTLRQSAHELALQASSAGMDLDEDEEVLDFVDGGGGPRRSLGLPSNLQHVIDVASSYLQGQVYEHDLISALDSLDRSVAGTHNKAANTPAARLPHGPPQKGAHPAAGSLPIAANAAADPPTRGCSTRLAASCHRPVKCSSKWATCRSSSGARG